MIKSIFKTVSFVADIISEIKNHEHNVRAMQDKMAQGIIDRVNEIEAEREANKVIPYNRTEEFQQAISDLYDTYIPPTHEARRALFAARASGELPPIFADDAETHLERQREQLEDWVATNEL